MELYYGGKRIDQDIDISSCFFNDRSGGLLDDLTVCFSDPGGRWGKWQPQQNDQIEIKDAGFSTGVLFIDVIGFKAGYFILKATPLRQGAKKGIYRTWEKVKFLELAGEAAAELGLALQTYEITNWLYRRMESTGQTFTQMLYERCRLEGYALKIAGGKMLIINEKIYDQKTAAVALESHELRPDYEFRDRGNDVSSVRVAYGDIAAEFAAPGTKGGRLEITDIPVWDIGEAERYAAGIARQRNRLAVVGYVTPVVKHGQIAAWTPVKVKGLGWPDGNYIVDIAQYDFKQAATTLKLRLPLTGY